MKWNTNGGSLPENKLWFAIKVRERFERSVSETMESKEIETFLPVYSIPSRRTDRAKTLEVPLFAGYTFCRIEPSHRLPILTIPGVYYFVGVGRVPVPVTDSEIESLRTLLRSRVPASPRPYLSAGERVRVEGGPLRGVEGVLLKGADNADQLVVSIELLQRSVAVTINRDSVAPLKCRRPDSVLAAPQMGLNI